MRKNIYGIMAAVCLSSVLAAGCGGKNQAETLPAQSSETMSVQVSETVAATEETAEQQSVGTEGMTPVLASELRDGVYQIQVDSSSSMFRIEACELTVNDGSMTADMKMGGTGYLKLYMGTGEEAAKAPEEKMIPFEEAADGSHHFTVPVEALDKELDCAAFSKKKEKWYDRVLVFRADSLPADALTDAAQVTAESLGLADGCYTVEVSMEGGSGRVSVESPAKLVVKDQKAVAEVVWSSPNYDYMKVGEEKFLPVNQGGETSVFEIPVTVFDRKMAVAADTTAMSTPHEIEYTLLFDSASAELRDEAYPLVNKLGKILVTYDNNIIEVEGHTDNVPIHSSKYEDNNVLSMYRALAVANYLRDTTTLDPAYIKSSGRGEYVPIADNATPEGRARNRRVEIKIYNSYNSNVSGTSTDDTGTETPADAALSTETVTDTPEAATTGATVEPTEVVNE